MKQRSEKVSAILLAGGLSSRMGQNSIAIQLIGGEITVPKETIDHLSIAEIE